MILRFLWLFIPSLKMCLGESQIQKERLNKMKKGSQKNFCIATGMLIAFLLWTAAIQFVDMQTIGPQESSVGFATINRFVHNLTGVHMSLYTITDWLGIIPILMAMVYAFIGLFQLIKRKCLNKVEPEIIKLGIFYIIYVFPAQCLRCSFLIGRCFPALTFRTFTAL